MKDGGRGTADARQTTGDRGLRTENGGSRTECRVEVNHKMMRIRIVMIITMKVAIIIIMNSER